MNSKIEDEKFMRRCLELAGKGLGTTRPNPLVGSVIVLNGKIIGEGFHRQAGGPHAEVNAINSVKDKSLLQKSTLYVNLEPCTHTGKTPPCSDLIVFYKIPKVVIGTRDPNPLVFGKGIERLRKNGCEVVTDILNEECYQLNRRFFTFHTRQRPYIILKWAETKDGFIDVIRDKDTPVQPNWISNELSRMLVHKWRTEEHAIMVGTNTALWDNPFLNVREWHGEAPVRIVLDRTLRLPDNLHLFDHSIPTLVFTEKNLPSQKNLEYIQVDFDMHVEQTIFRKLYEKGIQSVLIEGGKKLIDSMLREGLWDECRVFIGNKTFEYGITSPDINNILTDIIPVKEDRLLIYRHMELTKTF